MTDIFEAFKSIQATRIGIVTSAIIGLVTVLIFIIDFSSQHTLIPDNIMPYFLGYLGWIVALHLLKSITDLTRSTIKGKKCHYCGGPLEIFKHKCQNPDCGREQ